MSCGLCGELYKGPSYECPFCHRMGYMVSMPTCPFCPNGWEDMETRFDEAWGMLLGLYPSYEQLCG